MSWLYEAFSVPSERNGRIHCTRVLGNWSVNVDGCGESSSYMRGLWQNAVRRLPRDAHVKRILMLGLAAGASVEMLHRRFPGCHITAIEWDPVMKEVMERVRLFHPSHRPEILLGDAVEIVPRLHRKFDLILFDLYHGPVTPHAAQQRIFFEALQSLLVRDGFLIVNAYAQPQILINARACFAHQATWKFHLNLVALYRPFGAGTVGDPLPDGYLPHRCSDAFVRRDLADDRHASLIESGAATGIRYSTGLWCVEKYYGDSEPMLDSRGPKRLVIWQPVTRVDTPQGWSRSFVRMNAEVTGFVDLNATEDLFATWSPHAMRHLKRWRAERDAWEVVEPSLDQFLRAYMTSRMRGSLKGLHRNILERKSKTHGSRLHLLCLKRRSTGSLEAGFASLEIPELKQSIHIASFILDSAKPNPVGTGIIALWFSHAKERNIRFLDFDLFRGSSDPKAWKGFSRFKAQFGTIFIRYPYPLMRWAGTWQTSIKKYFAKESIKEHV